MQEHKCWFAGKATPDKSEFKIPARPILVAAPQGMTPRSAPDQASQPVPQNAASANDVVNDTWASLCGEITWGNCDFKNRWRLQ